jgi:hypothetical protein
LIPDVTCNWEQEFMSRDESPKLGRWEQLFTSYVIWLIVGPVVGFFGLILLYYALGGSSTINTKDGSKTGTDDENALETARQSLLRRSDLNTCRDALQRINSELGEKAQFRSPPMTAEQSAWLKKHAELQADEISELEGGNYTQLDGQHLDLCFLMRDAARALEVKGVRGEGGAEVKPTPLEQATAAFAWVMREVRLREADRPRGRAIEAVPPAFVLRRGWGAAIERALVFMALLEQINNVDGVHPELLGCLLFVPGEKSGMDFWNCGVVVGDGKDVYLFDPRLGLPLPGPKGQGVATLAEARKHPEVLSQLRDDKFHYDVTAEQARTAKVLLVCPLSSLSPRMRHLQEKLLAPTVRIRLAADAAKNVERVAAASAAEADKPSPVSLWRPAVVQLRQFLSKDEGGVDEGQPVPLAELRGFTLPNDRTVAPKLPRRQRFVFELVPWTALPPQCRDNVRFPYNSGLGQRVRDRFARPYVFSAMEPGRARDLILRGRYGSAASLLVEENEHWHRQLQRRANAVDLEKRADEWLTQAYRDYAAQLRAKAPAEREAADRQVNALWSEQNAEPIYLLLDGANAGVRGAEVTFLLGLCKHEQAEQLQARLELQKRATGKSPRSADVEKAKLAWQDALGAWKRYAENYSTGADHVPARLLRGRAEVMVGDWKNAVDTWKDLTGPMTDLEKLASLRQARELEKKHPK